MIVLFESIATSLQSYGLGTIGSDLFIGQLPSTPYESTVIAPSGGYEISGDKVNRPAVQFLHRSVKYNDGWTYINSLNTLFADKFNKLGCSYPGRFARQSAPGPYYKDENGHFVFSLNLVFITTKVG